MFWNSTRIEALEERIKKLEDKLFDTNSKLSSVRYQLGEMQRIGKRRMTASDIKDGMSAWREIEHVLYKETIERNNTPFKDMFPYPWCYAVGGPWGHIRLDIEIQKWWIEDKQKAKKK